MPVATAASKGLMPAKFYANSTIKLETGLTYKIASTTSTFIYMEYVVNSFRFGKIGEARIRLAKSNATSFDVKKALFVNERFRAFYTIDNGKTEIFIKDIKCDLLLAPSMDFRLNPYAVDIIEEKCEVPNTAKEFDYE